MPELSRPSLEYPAFVEEYLVPRRPVVVPGAVAGSRAVERWTLPWFKQNYGERQVRVDRDGERVMMPLGDYIAGVESHAWSETAAPPYLRNNFLLEYFPELLDDVEVPVYCTPNWLEAPALRYLVPPGWTRWVELFISAPRTRFPAVHVDAAMTHGWVIQVRGEKRYWFWPPLPGQPNYSPHSEAEDRKRGKVCLGRDLEQFFAHAAPIQVVAGPGDFVFIPAGWWHTAESLSASITLSGNFVNESNWTDFCESYFHGLKHAGGLESLDQAVGRIAGDALRQALGLPALGPTREAARALAGDARAQAAAPASRRVAESTENS